MLKKIDSSPLKKKSMICLSVSITAFAYADCPDWIETECPCNIYTDISFNYWQPIQENMELGLLDKGKLQNITTAGGAITSVATSDSFKSIKMDFDFKPGFTIGIGYKFACDAWDLLARYTWFHNTNIHRATAKNFVLFNSNAENISPTWGTSIQAGEDVNYQFASEKWKLGMDIIELELGRLSYIGCKLTLRPSFGARAAWIRQDVHISYTNGFTGFSIDVPGLLGNGFFVGNRDVHHTSHSWAVGPKLALNTNWTLGCGFRLFGNGEVDILYTRYSLLKEKSVTVGTVLGIIDLIPINFSLSDQTTGKEKNVDFLRTHLDLELGVGWGTHLNNCKCYLDCSAGYGFQVFFDQNMLLHDVTDPGSFIPNGNLYVQGLIIKLRIDF